MFFVEFLYLKLVTPQLYESVFKKYIYYLCFCFRGDAKLSRDC